MRYGPDNPDDTYVPHAYTEQSFDTGEVVLNYATTGSSSNPPILLIPAQTEQWWGYEEAMGLLAEEFQVFAVDLRGHGRSSWTPGRYTLDLFGNDLVRFVDGVIGRPIVASGLSSGGVISAWLSAYAPIGMLRGAHYEDPPLFAAELTPAVGPGIRQGAGEIFYYLNKYLGDQWSVGNVEGMIEAAPRELSGWLAGSVVGISGGADAPSQAVKEYDPEWGRAFWTGSVGASCDHAQMLSRVKCPVLITHHGWTTNENGRLEGAITDQQLEHVKKLVSATGQPLAVQSFPDQPHFMHQSDPKLYSRTVIEWAATLPK